MNTDFSYPRVFAFIRGFDQICCPARTIFAMQLLADFQRASRVTRMREQFVQLVCDSRRAIVFAIERAAGANLARVFGIV